MGSPTTVLLIEQNLDGTTGGSYRSMLYLVKLMDRRRFRPIAAFYRDHDLMEEYRAAASRTLLLRYPSPVDWVRGRVPPGGGLRRLLLHPLRYLQKVVNFFRVSVYLVARGIVLLAREHVDLLHLNNGVTAGNELVLAAKLLGRRCIIHQRGIGPVPRWNARVASLADRIVCVSDAARENLIRNGIPAGICTTIHNAIDPAEFLSKIREDPASVRSRLGIPPECPVIGLAGMIRQWKGQRVLLEAVALLLPRHPDLRCLVVGGVADRNAADQAYLESLREYVRTNALERTVSLLDYHGNVGEIVQTFDVMVHAAIDPEPFSRVVLEGMTLGRAIVATATGGTPEAIEDGVSGLLVRPGDPAALAERIGYLLDHPDERRRLAAGAQERIRSHFLISSNVAATEQVYEETLMRIWPGR